MKELLSRDSMKRVLLIVYGKIRCLCCMENMLFCFVMLSSPLSGSNDLLPLLPSCILVVG